MFRGESLNTISGFKGVGTEEKIEKLRVDVVPLNTLLQCNKIFIICTFVLPKIHECFTPREGIKIFLCNAEWDAKFLSRAMSGPRKKNPQKVVGTRSPQAIKNDRSLRFCFNVSLHFTLILNW